MNLFGQTLVLYLVVGAGVAGAICLSQHSDRLSSRWFLLATAVVFWPLYLPILLSPSRTPTTAPAETMPPDDLLVSIDQVDTELSAALEGLDGWAEEVLIREKTRLHDLSVAWRVQARRIHEMDRVLAQPEQAQELFGAAPPFTNAALHGNRVQTCRQARLTNIERLRRMRQQAYDDLIGSLAWVRELVSMIHLAKFSGAPAAKAQELVAQIAAAVEGLSELTWQEEAV